MSHLSDSWMDWGIRVNTDKPIEPQICQALAAAAKQYAVKFGIDPTRAKIHESQVSGQLALMAEDLGIKILIVRVAYNSNHILLSCDEPV